MSVCLIQGRSVVRVCESLSKLHEYVSPSELKLPSSTVSLEEDLKVSDFQIIVSPSILIDVIKLRLYSPRRELGTMIMLNLSRVNTDFIVLDKPTFNSFLLFAKLCKVKLLLFVNFKFIMTTNEWKKRGGVGTRKASSFPDPFWAHAISFPFAHPHRRQAIRNQALSIVLFWFDFHRFFPLFACQREVAF